MRLWTLHPQYLDAKGLIAVWREALLAQKVLSGGTKGYTRHPQVSRFRASTDPQAAIATYLVGIFEEAHRRGYAFDARKIGGARFPEKVVETKGQLLYEWRHLSCKLKVRAPNWYRSNRSVDVPLAHPLFRIVAGAVQDWERVKAPPRTRTKR